ncbi:hypothetical protein B7494_g7117 [Chlorociboria aeruginascens]|nr:hypothetical protein B7494_g7117 [Chlorociboria aeruginascens]
MSLWILKFNFHSSYRDKVKLSFFRAELYFKDCDGKRREDPTVQSWAPWRITDKSNFINRTDKATNTSEAGLEVGFEGNKAMLKHSRAHEVSFEAISFDKAYANTLKNRDYRPNSMHWQLEQDPSDDPYRVEFGFCITKGLLKDFYEDQMKTIFRRPDTPGGSQAAASLVKPTTIEPPGRAADPASPPAPSSLAARPPGAPEAPEALGAPEPPFLAARSTAIEIDDLAESRAVNRSDRVAPAQAAHSRQREATSTDSWPLSVHTGTSTRTPPAAGDLLGGLRHPPQGPTSPAAPETLLPLLLPGGDSSSQRRGLDDFSTFARLDALETRFAQAEAWLAAQDQIIWQL